MSMGKAAISFVQEFVIGVGLLSGLWICVGVDPEAEIAKSFASVVQQISPNLMYPFLFWLIPVIGTVASWAGAYFLGGWFGIVAVALAFFGGIFINSPIGVYLIIAGILIGLFAPHTQQTW